MNNLIDRFLRRELIVSLLEKKKEQYTIQRAVRAKSFALSRTCLFFFSFSSRLDSRCFHAFFQRIIVRTISTDDLSRGKTTPPSTGASPGRRDACTDCAELAASSKRVERAASGRALAVTGRARIAWRRPAGLYRCRFSSFPPPLFVLALSLSLSHPLVRIVGYNIQFIMYL